MKRWLVLSAVAFLMVGTLNGCKKEAPVLEETQNSQEASEEMSGEALEPKEEETSTQEALEENTQEESKQQGTPYDIHGAISVSGTNIVDQNGDNFQLCGVSTHGMAWFPEYVNKDAFQSLRDEWGANVVRLAMYTAENNGYCTGGNQNNLKSLVKDGVNYATELGMYVIVDWHVLHDLDPNVYKSDAISFFDEMSKEYKDQDNVIYEICNEPNGSTTWSQVKSYALEVIPVIRANDPNAIIIVGTPTWSQDVDIAAQDPITDYDNIMYAVHFYADTHRDGIRSKAETGIAAGLPIFITEFSICDASGNGYNNVDEANKWVELLDKYDISFVAWNLSNKSESSSLIQGGCAKKSGWSYEELSESGKWLVEQLNTHSDQGAGLINGQAGAANTATGNNANNSNASGNGSNNNGNSSSNGGNNTTSIPAATGEKEDLKVSVSTANSWQSGNDYFTQMNVTIQNNGSGDYSNWTLEVDCKQSVAIDQIWCAKASTSGNKVVITPESYNGTISGKSSISDIGFIVKTSSKPEDLTVSIK